jgi:hypothetical protein
VAELQGKYEIDNEILKETLQSLRTGLCCFIRRISRQRSTREVNNEIACGGSNENRSAPSTTPTLRAACNAIASRAVCNANAPPLKKSHSTRAGNAGNASHRLRLQSPATPASRDTGVSKLPAMPTPPTTFTPQATPATPAPATRELCPGLWVFPHLLFYEQSMLTKSSNDNLYLSMNWMLFF